MRSTRLRSVMVLLGVCVLLLAAPLRALAHPMGNFSINHFTSITVRGHTVRLLYVIDMAEIPTFQELSGLNVSSGDALSPRRRAVYLAGKARMLSSGLQLTVNGRAVPLRQTASDLIFPPGAGNLSTERIYLVLQGTLPGGTDSVSFTDNNFAGRAGWKEIVVAGAGGVAVSHSSAPASSRSQALTIYPTSLTSSAPQDVSSTFTVTPRSASALRPLTPARVAIRQAEAPLLNADGSWSALARQLTTSVTTRSFSANRNDPLTDLMKGHQLSVGFLLLSLVAAFWFGAGHALSPGHGKTMVAAYLVGSRGTWPQAVLLGTTVTITHTAGVFALGAVTLYFSQYILPDQLYPVLGFISGMLVAAMGLTLAVRRFQQRRRLNAAPVRTVQPRPLPVSPAMTLLPAGTLALARAEAAHTHSHGAAGVDHEHAHDHDHSHEHGTPHRHGPFGRSHTHGPLPGAHGEPVKMRSLIALGVSGGLLPCPSALVVLLSAIAFHRVLFGMVLIVAFSVGLATVLTGIGILMVYSGRLASKLPSTANGGLARVRQVSRVLPILSSLVVAALGLLIATAALAPGSLPSVLSSL